MVRLASAHVVLALLPAAVATLGAGCGARTDLAADGAASGGASNDGGAGGIAQAGGGEGGGGAQACPVDRLVGDPAGGAHIAIDDTHAYWTTLGGEILRGSLASGEVTSLASPGSSLGAITLDGSYLYGAASDQIFRVPKRGGALESLAPGAFEIVDLEVVGDSLFALDYGSGILSGRLYELSPSTGLVARFETLDFPRAIAADASDVFVIGNGALIEGEALLEGVLLRLPRATFEPQVLATQIRDPFGVHILGDAVLYGVGSNEDFELDARLLTVPRSGGDSTVLSQLGATGLPVGLAADSTNAYVTLPIFSFGGGPTRSQILRAPLAGGLAEVIFERIGWFFVLPAVTSSHVATTAQRDPPDDRQRDRPNVFMICK